MIITEVSKESQCPTSSSWIKKVVKAVAVHEKKVKGNLEVIIVSDFTMRRLNKKYRHKDKTTDVLSFAWQEDKKVASDLLGQIYLSWAQIKRQARDYRVSAREELARMLVHGVLHLIGYDHIKAKDEEVMLIRQEKYVEKIIKKHC